MNTQEFLRIEASKLEDNHEGHLHPRSGRTRYFQSVLCDGDALYSYGTHYPLYWFITTPNGKRLSAKNIQGYSNTTAKHIAHAPSADINVKLTDRYQVFKSANVIQNALEVELADLNAQMDAKKRKDTQVYHWLEVRAQEIESHLNKLTK